MAQPPAFQWYARDWLAGDARQMTLEEKGAHADLLSYAWLEEGLPSDPDRIARILGVGPREFKRIWPAVAPCWVLEEKTGKLVNQRQEVYRAELDERRERRRTSGAEGGRKRARQRISPKMRGEVFAREGLDPGEIGTISCTYCDAVLTMNWTRRDRPRLLDEEGRPTPELDHVIPLAKGGAHTAENLVPSCLSCNRHKGQTT